MSKRINLKMDIEFVEQLESAKTELFLESTAAIVKVACRFFLRYKDIPRTQLETLLATLQK